VSFVSTLENICREKRARDLAALHPLKLRRLLLRLLVFKLCDVVVFKLIRRPLPKRGEIQERVQISREDGLAPARLLLCTAGKGESPSAKEESE
jgi:hypothetical protein